MGGKWPKNKPKRITILKQQMQLQQEKKYLPNSTPFSCLTVLGDSVSPWNNLFESEEFQSQLIIKKNSYKLNLYSFKT